MRKTFMLVVTIFAFLLAPGAKTQAQSDGWLQFQGAKYKLTSVAGTWSEAEAVNNGGHLVTITTPEENEWLIRTFGNDKSLWIGFYQSPGSVEPAGGWRWSSGERVVYTNWDGGQPDNYTGRDNYAMLLSHARGKWHDVPLEGWPMTSKYRGIMKLSR